MLSPTELKQYIVDTYFMYYNTNYTMPSILIIGKAGIGKSEIVKQSAMAIAKKLNKQFIDLNRTSHIEAYEKIKENPEKYFVFIDLRLYEIEPVDMTGIPKKINGNIDYIPFTWIKILEMCDGIIFLDELLNTERPDQKSLAYKIALDHMAGFKKFFKNVMVLSASNPPEIAQGVVSEEISIALMSRFEIIYYDITTENREKYIKEWINYLTKKYKGKYEKRVIAFVNMFPEYLIVVPENPLEPAPNPRTWDRLAYQLYKLKRNNTNDKIVLQKCISNLGKPIGSKFYNFFKLEVPTIQEVLNNPSIFDDLNFEKKWLFTMLLAQKLDLDHTIVSNDERYFTLIRKIVEYSGELFIAMLSTMVNAIPFGLLLVSIEKQKYQDESKRIIKRLFKELRELRQKYE